MANEISKRQSGKFSFSAQPSALVGTVLLWGVLSWAAWGVVHFPPGEAMLLGLLATTAHWAMDVMHQLGHAWAASRTGHPMQGVRFWWLLSTSIYPNDEPELPKRIHMRRALGGPVLSLVVSILAAIWTGLVWPPEGVVGWLAVFVLVESLMVFTLGAFLPLGFTDGSTLLRLWRHKQ